MSQLQKSRVWWLGVLVTGAALGELLGLLSGQALAQITPDETLGGERSAVTRDVTVRGGRADRIDGGARRGANLFHSFSEFNVDNGQRVYFANPTGVENILGRVTGADVSDILGTLGVDGGANLFLLNPNGIMFGPNAQLDISGSFIATTGNRFNFLDGGEFGVINPQAPSLLTVSAPVGVQFGGNPGGITVEGSTLAVSIVPLLTGRTLALVGGDVLLDNANLLAVGGRLELGAAKAGTVGLSQSGNLFSLNFPQTTERADISIINDSSLGDLFFGSVAITGQNLNISGSSLLVSTLGSFGTSNVAAGDITLDVDGVTSLNQGSTIANIPANGGGGNIRITTGSLSLADNSNLGTTTLGLAKDADGNPTQSDSGDIIINARNAVSLSGGRISTNVSSTGRGNGGNIQINAGSLSVADGGELSASTRGVGDSGDININVRDGVSFANGSASTGVTAGARGTGGNIAISAGSVSLSNNASLSSDTAAQGNVGSISINTRGDVVLDGSKISNSILEGANGNGGNVRINAQSLFLRNGANIFTNVDGIGNGGSLIINTSETVSIDGSVIYDIVNANGVGNSGNIDITTRSLSLNQSQIQTQTSGQGDAGNIIINARDAASFNTSSLFSSVFAAGKGNGGNIEINTNSLVLTDSLQSDTAPGLIASTDGHGNSGSVIINASNSVSINRNNLFSGVGPNGVGSGGRIEITTGSLSVTNAGLITGVERGGFGDSGNVIINARDSVLLSRGGAYSNVVGTGDGGSIQITTGLLSVTDGWQLYSSTEGQGDAGSVIIDARNRVLIDGVRQDSNRSSSIYSSAESGASGRGGTIAINSPEVIVVNGGVINTRTGNTQPGGDITINTTSFEARNGGQGITTTSSSGRAGTITLNATGNVTLSGVDPDYTEERQRVDTQGAASGLYANTVQGSTGQGGSISITAGQLNVQDRAQVAANSQGSGQAGSLTVNANSVALDNQAELTAETVSSGGGNIDLRISDSLRLNNNSQISASTATGQGGSLTLNRDRPAANSVTLAGNSNLSAQATGTGNAGNVSLNTAELAIQDRSSVSATTTSGQGGNVTLSGLNRLRVNNGNISASTTTGRAGGVTINAADSVELDGANASLAVRAEGGTAGSLTINTGQLTVQNGAQATVSNTGTGAAGNLNVTARQVQLNNQAGLTAETEAASSGGNIDLRISDSLQLNSNSQNFCFDPNRSRRQHHPQS